ncbi:MAG: alpha-glucuronidase family glycosyl hydrolase, partial [Planctomycetota bacterium]|nr:alpha-glucuronidase family glycosyl hydrolase [Planctomycetota bacterium]
MNIFSLHSRTDCAIHIADEATVADRHGAEELRTFIHEMTGTELGIVDDAERLDAARNRILVGDSRDLRKFCPEPLNGIGPDGYRIRADGSRLAIWGAEPRGTLNGIYAFLHELGCRWYTRKVSVIPRRERIEVGFRDESFTPPISYRNFILDGVM